jgi:signal transduction histidine kinase
MTDGRGAQAEASEPTGALRGAAVVDASVGRIAALVHSACDLHDAADARARLLHATADALGVEGCLVIDAVAAPELAERCRMGPLSLLDVHAERWLRAYELLPNEARSALFVAMPDDGVLAAWSRAPPAGAETGTGARHQTHETHETNETNEANQQAIARVAATLLAHLTPRTRDEGRARFLAVVAHDLRTPVTAIAMTAESLLRAAPASLGIGRVRDAAVRIQRAARRMSALLADLLDFERLRLGGLDLQVRENELSTLVDEVEDTMRPLAEAKGLTLRARTSGGATLVPCDRARFVQLLSNLVQNAIKFTPEGGVVELVADAADDGARFTVDDTGPGIAAEAVGRIFDPYWQALRGDSRGLGLGLAIARGIAEAHGARIAVESRQGHGSRFVVTLPWKASGSGRYAVPFRPGSSPST